MTQQLVQGTPAGPLAAFADRLPPMIATADDRTAWRFVDFFAVTIRNPNTREAYYRAVSRFMDWCEQRGLNRLDGHQAHPRRGLRRAAPTLTTLGQAAPLRHQQMLRLDGLGRDRSTPTRQRLSSDRGTSSGSAGPRSSATTRPRTLLESISTDRVAGLRDRATHRAPCSTPSDASARSSPWTSRTISLSNHQRTFLLHEKGGKEHHVPAHHRLVEYLGEYMDATGLWDTPKVPLFQAVDITRSRLKGARMNRQIVFQMVRRRARRAGLPPSINCHSFRATGITNYLSNGGSLEDARAIAAHESSQTTRLYDRTGDSITLDEIERIRF